MSENQHFEVAEAAKPQVELPSENINEVVAEAQHVVIEPETDDTLEDAEMVQKAEVPKPKTEEQMLGENTPSALSPADLKAPSEIYRLGMLTSPRIRVDALNVFQHRFPKTKMVDGAVVFQSTADREYAETFTAGIGFYTPGAVSDRALEDKTKLWESGIVDHNNKRHMPQSHARGGTGAQALLARIRNTGAPITLWLPATGIHVTFTAPSEADYCDYDIQQAMEISEVGRLTHGLLMNASSGIYLRSMVEFALRYAIATSYDCDGGDIAQSLLGIIRQEDYGLVLTGPTIAKFPGGIPWTLSCPDGDCKATEEVNLNLARAIRYNQYALNDTQRKFMVDNRKNDSVTDSMLVKYREEFRTPESATYVINKGTHTITIMFQMTTLHKYFIKTAEWAEELNSATVDALGNRATAHEREVHIRQRNEARRLTRYAHMVKSIEVQFSDEHETITELEEDETKIITMLADLTSDRELVNEFETAIRQFTIDTTHTVLGYMASKCECCSKSNAEAIENGVFTGIVPISPDKLFFVLSQQVSTVQNLLSSRSE